MTTWFTADTHFFHYNIIRYTNRPFASTAEMNEALIVNWNACVMPEDIVYHLGDFGFGRSEFLIKILCRLNGKKHLVLGNHDKEIVRHPALFTEHFIWIKDYAKVHINNEPVILCHYPISVWDGAHHGVIHAHGHSHGGHNERNVSVKRIDVGIDNWNYQPISFEKIKEHMSAKENIIHK